MMPIASGYPAGSPSGSPAVNSVPEHVPSRVVEELDPVYVPQIVVGVPSPAVEPSVIGHGFRSFPFRPDTVVDGWSTGRLTVRAASMRGHLHRYNGAPRQDDFAVHHLPNGRVIVVVADGVSQAAQSHIGAATATRYAAQWLQSELADNVSETDWATMVKSTAWALTEQAQSLLGLDQPDAVLAEKELATTFVCAVIEPTDSGLRAYLVGVGDSSTWLLSPAGEFFNILGGKSPSDSGISSSAVSGLPRVPAELTPAVIDVGRGSVLLVGTDGIGDPLGSGQGAVGNLLRDALIGRIPSLIEFARVVDFSRETFDDDRTLVAVWNAPGHPDEVSGW